MKPARLGTGLVASLALTAVMASPAAAESFLSVGHGIPGEVIGQDPTLPVDVSVDGTCLLTGVHFGMITEPLAVEPGDYKVEIRLSDGACSGPLVIADDVSISLFDNATVIAHFTDSLSLRATKFVNDVRSAAGSTRLIVRHTADAPAVDILARPTGQAVIRLFTDLSNGDQAKADLPAGDYTAAIVAAGVEPQVLGDLAFGPVDLSLAADTTNIVYAVGSLGTSFTVLVQTLEQ